MSLRARKAFFRARTGNSDANAQAIIDGLRALGHFVVPIRASEPGVPDLYVDPRWPDVIKNPRGIWLELKTLKGKLRKSQLDWRAKAEARGIRVAVARNLDEAIAAVTS